MKILLVHPAPDFSVIDVSRGYRGAFLRAGHEVIDYRVGLRMRYHAQAIGDRHPEDPDWLYRSAALAACETVVVEALRHEVDWVCIVSGLAFHPGALALLRAARIPTTCLHTESPYQDADQLEWSEAYPEMRVFTHERTSAARHGWGYLAHAYDPEVHCPVWGVTPDLDVLIIGTGWAERQALLEGIDWTGITLSIRGNWPGITESSPLWPFYQPGCVLNKEAAAIYTRTLIGLNMHRAGDGAESLNPRAYELAACGVFQLSDARAELADVFGDSVPTFATSAELERLIRRYLDRADDRLDLAARQHEAVRPHAFDARAAQWVAALTQERARCAA